MPQVASPGFHYVTPGLLQFYVQWYHSLTVSTFAVSSECGSAAHITGTSRCDHITSVLRELHWLPVRQRVECKLAVLVYKSLHGLTVPHLTDDCQLGYGNAWHA